MSSEKIIDGRILSSQIKKEVKEETRKLYEEKGIKPGLAFILVGEDPASQVYVRNKGKACEETGFHSVTNVLPEKTEEGQILDLIRNYNEDRNIHGILVQLPLPKHINEDKIIEAIDYRKDVDGFHPHNVGNLLIGRKGFISCTPYGIIEMIKRNGITTSGMNTVIIGRSNIVGKPMAALFLRKDINSTVTICHSATRDIKEYTLGADILVAAIGKPFFVKEDMVKAGAVIIDVGINRIEDKNAPKGTRLVGDVDYDGCIDKASKITPVPGGVGLMTIAMLMRNTLDAALGRIF